VRWHLAVKICDSSTPGAVFKTVFVSIRRKNQLFLKEEKKK
jgi:hypothetical protein